MVVRQSNLFRANQDDGALFIDVYQWCQGNRYIITCIPYFLCRFSLIRFHASLMIQQYVYSLASVAGFPAMGVHVSLVGLAFTRCRPKGTILGITIDTLSSGLGVDCSMNNYYCRVWGQQYDECHRQIGNEEVLPCHFMFTAFVVLVKSIVRRPFGVLCYFY